MLVPGGDHDVVSGGFWDGFSEDLAGEIGVKVAEEIGVVLVLGADVFDPALDEMAEVVGEDIGAGAFSIALAPTGERGGVETGDVVDLILIEGGIDRAVGVRAEGVEVKTFRDLNLAIDPFLGRFALGVEKAIDPDHVPAVAF